MFRNELKEKLKSIFGFSKVTFDAPGESYEQDTLFIEVQKSLSRATEGRAFSRVTGQIVVYSQNNKLPYGFFHKRLGQVDKELTKEFFFFDFDVDVANSPARLQNINERRTSFVFLFSTQYDPAQGQLTDFEAEQVQIDQVLTVNGQIQLDIGTGEVLEI
jgi:hypothetical protein